MLENQKAYFNDIYDACYLKVKNYVITKCSCLSDVEDILQETFTEFYLLICKKGIEYIKNAEAIIIHIAKTKIYKHYTLNDRLKKIVPLYKNSKDGNEYETQDNASNIDVEQKYINDYTISQIWKIIKSQPKATQKIFALYYYSGYTIKEIALELKMTQSNVKHKLYRTLDQIRYFYKKEGELKWKKKIFSKK